MPPCSGSGFVYFGLMQLTRSFPACAGLALGLSLTGFMLALAVNQDKEPAGPKTVKPKHSFTNRLAKEKSPYLQQHKYNPVDWYPWGEEAFAKAKKENKPIFLSIGYSTCHWCHVMERETFEDEEVAKVLNKHFVNIKIDREERPDVDKIYMTYVQARTQRGGWPLTAFLTPELTPFFGGTYFKKEQFMDLLGQVNTVWSTKEKELREDADGFFEKLNEALTAQAQPDAQLKVDLLAKATVKIKGTYDPRFGGFGDEPKFPRPSEPAFVLSRGTRTGDQEAVQMVLFTCEKMAAGGMNDQLGGGFARYSVDAKWLVPHFEKMLYDNAQLVHLYLDAYLVSGEQKHADVARDVLRYIQRDMTHKDGGWFSAEDADSEGHEGKFYCWTEKELKALLTAEEFGVAKKHFGLTPEGNFEDHSHPEPLKHLNVLSIVDDKLEDAERKLLASARKKMINARAKRVRPHLDDKVLSSWNGLMLGAMARASAVLGEEAYLTAALKNHAFVRKHLWEEKTKTMYHRWREGERDTVQLLDAYAFQLEGLLHLYEATLDPAHLSFAIAVADQMIKRFHDPKQGGFWQATGSKDLIIRLKEDYDGALPSANSVAALALLRLAAITENKDYRAKAEGILRLFATRMEKAPQAVPYLMQALDFWLHEPWRAVVAGDAKGADTRKLVHAVHQVYQPNKVVLGNAGPVEEFATTLKAGASGPVAYLCTGKECKEPTTEVEVIQRYLKIEVPEKPADTEGPAKPEAGGEPSVNPGASGEQNTSPAAVDNAAKPENAETEKDSENESEKGLPFSMIIIGVVALGGLLFLGRSLLGGG